MSESEQPPNGERAEPSSPDEDEAPTKAEIEEAIETLRGEVVDDAGSSDLRATRTLQTLFHSGPLPSDDWFAGMEKIEPGITRDIVDDYLEERKHQRGLQKEALDIDKGNFHSFARYQYLQLGAAWSLAVLFGAAGIVLIATGHQITGFVWLIVEIAVLAAVFLGRDKMPGRGSAPEGESGDQESPQLEPPSS